MTAPTIGRMVLFHASGEQSPSDCTDHPAVITRVFSETCVNLMTFPDCGSPTVRTSVPLLEEPGETYRWSWPPRVTEDKPTEEQS